MAFGIIVKGVKVTLKEVKLQRCLTVRSTRKNPNNYFKRRVVPVEIQKMLQGSGRIRIRLLQNLPSAQSSLLKLKPEILPGVLFNQTPD
jgi:hypothetical protein